MTFCNGEMMKVFRLAGIKLTLDETEDSLAAKAAGALAISPESIIAVEMIKKAIDARRNKPPHFVYVLKVKVPSSIKLPHELEGAFNYRR